MKKLISASPIIVVMLAVPAVAMAADGTPDEALPRLGLDPGEPQVRSATPALPFGVQPALSREYVSGLCSGSVALAS